MEFFIHAFIAIVRLNHIIICLPNKAINYALVVYGEWCVIGTIYWIGNYLHFRNNAGHCANSCPKDSLLKDIGAALVSHDQCVKLALALQLGDDDIYKLVEAAFTEDLAYKLLKKWTKAENATGLVLHAALCVAERQDLADRYEDKLLGRGQIFLT